MFGKLSRFRGKARDTRSTVATTSRRPFVECLEGRLVPNGLTINWTAQLGGSFDNAANWTVANSSPPVHQVPGSGDTAIIGISGVTITAVGGEIVGTLSSNSLLDVTAGTFTVQNTVGSSTLMGGLEVDSGATFSTTGGMTSVAGVASTITGTLSTASGATLAFAAGTSMLNNTNAMTGAGLYDVNGGTVTLNLTVPTTAPANLELDSGGTINGTGTLTINTVLTWTGGLLEPANTVVSANGTIALSGAAAKILNIGALHNAGTMTWSGTGDWQINDGAIFNNSGTFTILNNQTIEDLNGTSTINNDGVWTKNIGVPGTTTIDCVFNNTNQLDVASGVLAIQGGGANSGPISVASGDTLLISGGLFALNDKTVLNGTGTYLVSGGSAVLSANVGSAPNLSLSSGTLTGTGTFAVTGTLNWTGGTVSGTGFTLSIPSTATAILSGNTDKTVNGATISLAGTTNWSGNGNIAFANAAVLSNLAGANFNIQNDASVNGIGAFTSAGTLTKSPTLGTTAIASSVTFTNNGGTVNVQSGTLDVAGGYTQNTGTSTVAAGATLISSSNHTVTINSGTLAGSGNIGSVSSATNVVNGGTVSPGGGTAGALTINGNYTQGSGGTLAIDLGGHTAGTQFDQLVVTGTATLAGTLSLTDINSFLPGNGDTYVIVTFASATGSFKTVNGSAVTPSFGFAPAVNSKNVTLQVSTTPGTLQFQSALPIVNESTGSATITVTRTGGTAGSVTVHFATSDGTGVAGTKYTPTSGTLTFGNGIASQSFTVTLLNDGMIDGNETVNLTLSNPTGGATLGTVSTSQLTVQDINGTQVQRYVATVYWAILNRHVDPSGLASWTGLITGGGTRAQMVRDIENSNEYHQDEVKALYLKYLHRTPDAGGLANFTNFIANGGTVEQVAAILAGSAEYLNDHGGTVAGFLSGIYGDALGRTVDSVGQAAFTLALKSGASNQAVATAIFGSIEYLDDIVNGYYLQFLRRPADSGGLSNFATAIQNGSARDEDVIANLIGSTEFLSNLIGP
jgi:hypothetical protein